RETATRPTQASHGPTISDDGRFIAYYSSGSNLVPGDDNWAPDAFLFDRRADRG
ncbi:MAG: hypothetical protein JWM05_1540, partial [Acidimicrobiales bacterium]|nr:hypothetical protein [Acidimicrobiales bacterium]